MKGIERTGRSFEDYTELIRATIAAFWMFLLLAITSCQAVAQSLLDWAREFPCTDFSRATVPLREIRFDGARRDRILPIAKPEIKLVNQVRHMGYWSR